MKLYKSIGAVLAAAFLSTTLFAASDQLDNIIDTLADDVMNGRTPGSAESAQARQFLIKAFQELGLKSVSSLDSFEQKYPGGVNLIAIHNPNESDGEPAVLITAHYDHVSSCDFHGEAQSWTCNGAADNAAGVASALHAIQLIGKNIQAPIALALWDQEEHGLKGSAHFAANPAFEADQLKLIINLDTIGLDLFPGLENHLFIMGGETGGAPLQKQLDQSAVKAGLQLTKFSYAFSHNRNDNTSFAFAGWTTPMLLLTDADATYYHSTADEPGNVNRDKVRRAAVFTANLAKSAANTAKFPFQKPGFNGPLPIPLFQDVRTGLDLLKIISAHASIDSQAKQVLHQLEQNLKTIEKNGIDAFDDSIKIQFLKAMQKITEQSRRLAQ